MTLNKKTAQLFEQQTTEWQLLSENVKGLAEVQVKNFQFDGFKIKVQHNPKRIISSSAKTDKKSIEQRPCFLCKKNRPNEQCNLTFGNYEILCNPFPIFEQHFTISNKLHIPQSIENSFADMLQISKELSDFVVFYNGANCGASAPDHLHFQAGNKGFLTIEQDYSNIISQYGKPTNAHKNIKLTAVNDGLRTFFAIESNSQNDIETSFFKIYNSIQKTTNSLMLNILSWYNNGIWRVIVFLRGKHRPYQFFETGDKQILFSPASVDMGGVIILPISIDFERITKEQIEDMMSQVCWQQNDFDKLISLF